MPISILALTGAGGQVPGRQRRGDDAVRDRGPQDVRVLGAVHLACGQPVLNLAFSDGSQHVEQREEDRKLDDQGQAARERVGAVLLVELHDLLVHRLLVVLVFLPQRRDLGGEGGHLPLRVHLLHEQRHQDQPHQHDQDDDGQGPGPSAVVAEGNSQNPVQPHQYPCDRVVEGVENPHVLAPLRFCGQRAGLGPGRLPAGTAGRHGIVATRVERMTAGNPGHGEPESTGRTVYPQSFQGVRAARRLEPAPRRQQRADEAPVAGHRRHQRTRDHRRARFRDRRDRAGYRISPAVPISDHDWRSAPTCRRSNLSITRARSAARSAWRAAAAGGLARTTSRLPAGSTPRYPRTSTRRRRFTRLRTTAVPTARLTMNPTLAGSSFCGRRRRCAVTRGRPARVPRRTARVNSVRCRILDSLGSTSGHPGRAAPGAAGPWKRSGAEARATLLATRRENGTASAGTHAQPEAVGLRPAAIVRLERALAHRKLQMR